MFSRMIILTKFQAVPSMHYYTLIKYKYALKEKWFKYANICNIKILISYTVSQKKFLFYCGTFIIQRKKCMNIYALIITILIRFGRYVYILPC